MTHAHLPFVVTLIVGGICLILLSLNRVLRYPGLPMFIAAFAGACLRFAAEPYFGAPTLRGNTPWPSFLALAYTVCFVLGTTSLVPISRAACNRWRVGLLAPFVTFYVLTMAVGLHNVARGALIATCFAVLAALAIFTRNRRPNTGLEILGICLSLRTVAFIGAYLGLIPAEALDLYFALTFSLLALSVLACHVLLSERKANAELARRMSAELELASTNALLRKAAQAQETELGTAASFIDEVSRSATTDLRHSLTAGLQGVTQCEEAVVSGNQDKALERLAFLRSLGGQLLRKVSALKRIGEAQNAPLQKQRVSMETMADGAYQEVSRAGYEVPVFFTPLPEAWADPALTRKIFRNLLDNAMRFARCNEAPQVIVGCLQDDPTQGDVFFVKDNGPGFDPALAASLFHSSGTPTSSGIDELREGVGVAVVQRIVERHGGMAWAESEPGQGATFFFTLSAAKPAATPQPSPLETVSG